MGTGEFNAEGSPVMDYHPVQGRVEIFLVASCYRSRDKHRPDGPLGPYADFFYVKLMYLPSLTGNDTSPFLLPHSIQSSSLPPLVITGIGHVKNIAIFETKTLAGEAAVLGFVVLKQSPAGTKTYV